MPSGFEFESSIATIGISDLLASFTAKNSLLVSMINNKSGFEFRSLIRPIDLFNFSAVFWNLRSSFFVYDCDWFSKISSIFFNLFMEF